MKIAVVIPCRNEVKNIEECIHAIFESDVPDSWEIKVNVVDGLSDDGTIELLQSLQNQYPLLSIVVNHKKVTPIAFNLGIQAGDGCDYVQIIGARQVIDKTYIRKAVERLESDKSIWCVGGKVQNVFQNYEGKIIASAMSTSLGMGIGNFRTVEQSAFVDTVGTPMYPFWVFEKIGFFDEELIRNQDDDFNFRVINAGGKIFFDASISLKYYVRGNFQNLKTQFYQYGYWKVFVNRKHKAVTTIRQLVPPLFVVYLLLMALSWVLGSLVGSVSSTPLLIYFALVGYTSYKLQMSDTNMKFFDLFKTFPILHISYGWGYLRGIVDFIILNKKPSDRNKALSR